MPTYQQKPWSKLLHSTLVAFKGTESGQKSSFLFCLKNFHSLELPQSFQFWEVHLPVEREIRMRFVKGKEKKYKGANP